MSSISTVTFTYCILVHTEFVHDIMTMAAGQNMLSRNFLYMSMIMKLTDKRAHRAEQELLLDSLFCYC